MNDELWRLSARKQAECIRSGAVSASELVDAAIARIEQVEPTLHALASTEFDRARERARENPRGPLGGVPFLVKDLIAYPGMRHSMGSRLFAANIATESTPYTERLDAAGLIVLGKTTTSEFGLLGSTETLLEGVTHNPWDPSRSAGGSSGGSAAAVASGMVAIAHASDGGGSIRGPASMNGVFGFKPGRGRVVPTAPMDMYGLLADHAVSVAVEDSALLLSLTELAPEGGKSIGFIEGPSRERLRIGQYWTTLLGASPSDAVRSALTDTAELCRSLGHDVIETEPPPVDGAVVRDAFFALAGEGMVELDRMMQPMLGRPLDDRDLEPFTLALMERYRALPESAHARAHAAIERQGTIMQRYLEAWDVVLCPTIPVEPWELGTLAPAIDPDTLIQRTETLAGYTAIHNFAGVPAMSVPLSMSERSLPIGSHFAAAAGREASLLALAYELEAARPWKERLPRLTGRSK